jgi:DNA polymerase III delta subunit
MIRAFLGDDPVTVRAKAHSFLDTAGTDGVVRVTVETYVPGLFLELSQSQSLFGEAAPVILDYLDDDDAIKDELQDMLEVLGSSARLFVLMGYAPLAPMKKALTRAGVEYTEVAPAPAGERFNTFALADALARKDKRSLWLLLARAMRAGVESEEIAGVLFWQLKALRLAAMTKNAKEAGMKDFPYNKAKGALKNWKDGELEKVSESLLATYHDGHRDADMAIGLERLVLRI